MRSSSGGWSFTAYSNGEPFSVGAVKGYAQEMERHRMDNRGVYAGSAQNTMLRALGDREYVEACNIAFIQSHGNTSGPDVEYHPPASATYGLYRWGDRGKLQWIACGGCDILGLVTYPNGSLAAHKYPNPSRWNIAFQGISGILGFRSSSYYQPRNYRLGSNFGAMFAREFCNGKTLWHAWVLATDYLHRMIGVRAEACVHVNSELSLNDKVTSYNLERKKVHDINSLRRQLVGRGGSPTYSYCHQVDSNGNYTCALASKGADDGRLDSRLYLACDLPANNPLPVYSLIRTQPIVIGDQPYLPDHEDSSQEAVVVEMLMSEESARALVGSLESSREKEFVRFEPESTLEIPNRLYSGKHAIMAGDGAYDIFCDFGLSLDKHPSGDVMARFGPSMQAGDVLEYRSPVSEMSILQAFLPWLASGAQVDVEFARLMYTQQDLGGVSALAPVLVCYATVTGNGVKQSIVELVN